MEEKQSALRYLMFLKNKSCGRIKGRRCAYGQKQRGYINIEEASSPTVITEAMILSCIMDALEGQGIATIDIPEAFLHDDMDDIVNMQIYGAMTELLTRVDPGQ